MICYKMNLVFCDFISLLSPAKMRKNIGNTMYPIRLQCDAHNWPPRLLSWFWGWTRKYINTLEFFRFVNSFVAFEAQTTLQASAHAVDGSLP